MGGCDMSWLVYVREELSSPLMFGEPLSTTLSCVQCFHRYILQNLGDAVFLPQTESACLWFDDESI